MDFLSHNPFFISEKNFKVVKNTLNASLYFCDIIVIEVTSPKKFSKKDIELILSLFAIFIFFNFIDFLLFSPFIKKYTLFSQKVIIKFIHSPTGHILDLISSLPSFNIIKKGYCKSIFKILLVSLNLIDIK